MYKKILIGLAPLLAVAAFAAMPAMASAQTRAYGTCVKGQPHTSNCPAGQKFKAFSSGEAVEVVGGLAPEETFVFEGEFGDWECTTLTGKGTLENSLGIGHGHLKLVFDDCVVTSGPLAGCEVENIEGNVTDEVQAGGVNVTVTIVNGFALSTTGKPAGCPAVSLGNFTGSATGDQAEGSNDLVFTKAPGLKFLEKPFTITGSDESFTKAGNERVLID